MSARRRIITVSENPASTGTLRASPGDDGEVARLPTATVGRLPGEVRLRFFTVGCRRTTGSRRAGRGGRGGGKAGLGDLCAVWDGFGVGQIKSMSIETRPSTRSAVPFYSPRTTRLIGENERTISNKNRRRERDNNEINQGFLTFFF